MLTCKIQQALVPKRGVTADECEDAYFLSSRHPQQHLTVYMADGATESSFAKLWATLLTDELGKLGRIKKPDAKRLSREIKELQTTWQQHVNSKPLPWYAEEKARKGAFSTFLGLWVDLAAASYQALAIGDTCVFHIRENKLLTAFPATHSKQLGLNPWLIGSVPAPDADLRHKFQQTKGLLASGDTLLLCTDALAHWLLAETEQGHTPWLNLPTDLAGDFALWLDDKRDTAKLKNDDTALIIIKFE